jgi:uncharacterized protein YfcZ (UPF0381/DUF406 family)
MSTTIKIALENLDTTVNQQTQEQVEIVKDANLKEATQEIVPIVKRPKEANPDASVSGETALIGDSSINEEKPTPGIDSGSQELLTALEEMNEALDSAILDVGSIIEDSDNAERLSAVVNSVESPTENELALITLAADIANVSDDEQIAAESIDEIRTLIKNKITVSNEGIFDSVADIFKGIAAWFKAKFIMLRTTAGRIHKLEQLLAKYKGKEFSIEAKANPCNYIVDTNGESRLLFKSSDWANEVKATWDNLVEYMRLLGQGILFMSRDFSQALTKLFKSDGEKLDIAKNEYSTYITKMVTDIQKGLNLPKDTTASKGNYSEYVSGKGIAGFKIIVKHTEIKPEEVDSPAILTNALKTSYTEAVFDEVVQVDKDKCTFDISTNDLLDMVRHMGKKNDEICKIFENMFMDPITTMDAYLGDNMYEAPSRNNHGIVNAMVMAENARAAIQRNSALGKLLTALATNAKNSTFTLTDTIDYFEENISKFVTSVVVSQEIKQ